MKKIYKNLFLLISIILFMNNANAQNKKDNSENLLYIDLKDGRVEDKMCSK